MNRVGNLILSLVFTEGAKGSPVPLSITDERSPVTASFEAAVEGYYAACEQGNGLNVLPAVTRVAREAEAICGAPAGTVPTYEVQRLLQASQQRSARL